MDSSISADKKSSNDDFPSESRSTSDSLTCSGESDSVVKEDSKEPGNSDSNTGTFEPVKPTTSNIDHGCSHEDTLTARVSVLQKLGERSCLRKLSKIKTVNSQIVLIRYNARHKS